MMKYIERKLREAQVKQLMKKDNQLKSLIRIILTVVGAIVVAAAAAYGLFKFFTPDYLDDFEDDFEDDFDDNFFDEEASEQKSDMAESKSDDAEAPAAEEDMFAE